MVTKGGSRNYEPDPSGSGADCCVAAASGDGGARAAAQRRSRSIAAHGGSRAPWKRHLQPSDFTRAEVLHQKILAAELVKDFLSTALAIFAALK